MADVVYDLMARIGVDTTGLVTGVEGARSLLTGSGVPAAAKRLGKTISLAFAGAGYAAFKFTKSALQVGMDFDSAMSQVKAIAGANADQFEELREMALYMGRTTKFTAVEAAEALNYMAMAGWKTDQMIAGLPGIMNLAAAAGEDLGTVSDIVTDALTAFGLTAEDSTHFADVLAAAAANSNTNVYKMGETFKYAAPFAGTLGYTIEDTAIAIGLMASSGIKASMAGTALRSFLSRLANPTAQSEMAMAALGIKLSDDTGRMYTLMELMQNMRESFRGVATDTEGYVEELANLDDAYEHGEITQEHYEKMLKQLAEAHFKAPEEVMAQLAAELGGQRALAGLLAIVNATDEDFEALAKSIYTASEAYVKTTDGSVIPLSEAMEKGLEIVEQYTGAAEAMKATMLDNLGGDLTLLKSAWEGMKIEFASRLTPELRKVMPQIIDMVGRLTEKIQNMDMEKLAQGIANFADRIISLIEWILDHSDEVMNFITTLAKTFLVSKVAGTVGKTGIDLFDTLKWLFTGKVAGGIVSGAARGASGGATGSVLSGGLVGLFKAAAASPLALPALVAALFGVGMHAEGKTQRQYMEESTLSGNASFQEHMANILKYAALMQSFETSGEEGGSVKAAEAKTGYGNAVDQFTQAAKGFGITEEGASALIDAAKTLGEAQANFTAAEAALESAKGTKAEGRAKELYDAAAQELADAQEAYDTALADVEANTTTTLSVVRTEFQSLSPEAQVWGADMVTSFANGMLQGYSSSLLPTVFSVAAGIAGMFEHSEPDEGPLANDSTWMPDMMASWAQGIRDNRGEVLGELDSLASDMSSSMTVTAPATGVGAVGGGNVINFSPTITIDGDITDPRKKAEELMVYMREIFIREAYA